MELSLTTHTANPSPQPNPLSNESDQESRDSTPSRQVCEPSPFRGSPDPQTRVLCATCNVSTTDVSTHWSEFHAGSISATVAGGRTVRLERMSTGFFRCPLCTNDQIKDARSVKVSRSHPFSASDL